MSIGRAASKPLYFSVAPGVPQTVLAQETILYGFTLSQATGGPIQITARNAAQTVVYGVFRTTINQTPIFVQWPVVVDGLHITLDVGAAAVDVQLEVGHS